MLRDILVTPRYSNAAIILKSLKTVSNESAITSRDISEYRIAGVPIEIPSPIPALLNWNPFRLLLSRPTLTS